MSPHTILTPTQEQVLSLIAAGSTATAAASAGIHRNTISNWLRGSPACISTRLSTGASKPNRSPWPTWQPRPPPSAPRQAGAKVGRNEACPCGSGKKFKRCCLSKPADSHPGLPDSEPRPPELSALTLPHAAC
jgi:hypothetical protein